MKSVLSAALHHGTLYWLALNLGRFASVLLLPLYTRYLTTADYGTMELLDLTCSVAISLLGIRLADSMLCYYFDARTPQERSITLTTALLGSLLIGSAFSAMGWYAAPLVSRLVFTSARYAYYFRLIFLSVALSLPQSVGYTYLRAENRSHLFLAMSGGRLAFQVALVLWLLVMRRMGFAAMVWTALVTSAIEALWACWYVLRARRISFDWRIFRKLSAYGAPLAAGSVGMLILHFGDRYVLSHWVSLSEIGVYSLGYKVGMLVAQAQAGFSQYWSAQMFAILRRADGDRLYVRIATYYTVASLFVALGLSLCSRPLLELLVPSAYRPGAAFVPVIALAYVLRGLGDYLRSTFFVAKRTGFDATVIWCGVAVCVVLYAVLIPRLGGWGAAIATLTAFGTMVPLSFWLARRIRRHAFEWKRMTVAGACAFGLYGCGEFLLARRLGPGIAVAALCSLAFPGALLAIGFFDGDEKAAGRQVWAQMRQRFAHTLALATR